MFHFFTIASHLDDSLCFSLAHLLSFRFFLYSSRFLMHPLFSVFRSLFLCLPVFSLLSLR